MNICIYGSGRMATSLAAHIHDVAHFQVIMICSNNDGVKRIHDVFEEYNLNNNNLYDGYKDITVITFDELKDNQSKYLYNKYYDFCIEATNEDIDKKVDIFKKLDSLKFNKDCIFASLTSSIRIDLLTQKSRISHPLIGLHFFNPINKIKLVEVNIDITLMSDEYINIKTQYLCMMLQKTILYVNHSVTSIANRLLIAEINNAIIMHELYNISIEDIDVAAEKGLNRPMGPFKLADYVGLDIIENIMESFYNFGTYSMEQNSILLKDNVLHELVKKGDLGRKTGKGFYNYNSKEV